MLSRLATLFNVVPQEALLSGARLHGNSPYKGAPAHGSAGMGHRSEIDGLRAIAVLSVVFYHFSVPGFGGGFVGVDIFFVISGFLIGDILWRELTTRGTLSLARFYARRIRTSGAGLLRDGCCNIRGRLSDSAALRVSGIRQGAIEACLRTSDEDLRRMGLAARKRVLDRHSIDKEAAKLAALFAAAAS